MEAAVYKKLVSSQPQILLSWVAAVHRSAYDSTHVEMEVTQSSYAYDDCDDDGLHTVHKSPQNIFSVGEEMDP